jgi:hypothetical protein
MPSLDDLRTQAEKNLAKLLDRLDNRHRKAVKAAIKHYGRVQDIPEIFWLEMEFEIEQEQVAAIALLILAADEWTSDEIDRQGVRAGTQDRNAVTRSARDQVHRTAAATVDTLRKRLERKVEDARVSRSGDVGELTDVGLDDAIDSVFTQERRSTIATDSTTTAFSTGQRTAAERAGRDGIRNEDGQRVTLELIWRTERDNLVCSRCSPLEGTNEDVWGKVFPNGPGPEAHPNCRCSLQPQVVVEAVRESVQIDIEPTILVDKFEPEVVAAPESEPLDLSPILEAIENIPQQPAPIVQVTEQHFDPQPILEAIEAIPQPAPPPDVLPDIKAIYEQATEAQAERDRQLLEAIKSQPNIEALFAKYEPDPYDDTHTHDMLQWVARLAQPKPDPEPYDDSETRDLLKQILAELTKPAPEPTPQPLPEPKPDKREWNFEVVRDQDKLITSIRAVKESVVREREEKGRWITIKGNAVKIDDDGTVLTGPMKGEKLSSDSSDKKPVDRATKEKAKQEKTAADINAKWNKATGSLSPDQRREFAKDSQEIMQRMAPAAAAEAWGNVDKIVVAKDAAQLSQWIGADSHHAAAAYDAGTKTLLINAAASAEDRIGHIAHELSHAIDRDGIASNSDEWKDAWRTELAGGKFGKQAAIDPAEGFAEIGRALWGQGKYSQSQIAKTFPKTAKIFIDNRLLRL